MKSIYKIKVDEGFTISDFQVSRTDTEIEIAYEKTEKPFTPKEGDIIFVRTPSAEIISIFKRYDYLSGIKIMMSYCHVFFEEHNFKYFRTNDWHDNNHVRLANDDEKKILFDEIDKYGLEWNPNTKMLVNKRWRAAKGEEYYYLTNSNLDIISKIEGILSLSDEYRYKIGNYFQTREEAEEYQKKIIDLLTQR